ncbi:MAG: hypothetical protein P4L46_25530 [Fimbriimonas sp.]|nr:hypothetical protein [Fimbriimonas sp.]
MSRHLVNRFLAVWLAALTASICFSQQAPQVNPSDIDDGVKWIEDNVDQYLKDHSVAPVTGDSRHLLDQYKLHFLLLFDTSQSTPTPEYREYYAGIAKEFLQHRQDAQHGSTNEAHFSTLAYQLDLYLDLNGPGGNLACPSFDNAISAYGEKFALPVAQIGVRTDGTPYRGGKNHTDSRMAAIEALQKKVSDPIIVVQFASAVGNEGGPDNVPVPMGDGSLGGLPAGFVKFKDSLKAFSGDSKAYIWLYGPTEIGTTTQSVAAKPEVTPPATTSEVQNSGADSSTSPPNDSAPVSNSGSAPPPQKDEPGPPLGLILGGAAVLLVVIGVGVLYGKQKASVSIGGLPRGEVRALKRADLYASTGTSEGDAKLLALTVAESGNLPEGGIVAHLGYDPLSKTAKLTCAGGFTLTEGDSETQKSIAILRKGESVVIVIHQDSFKVQSGIVTIGLV